MSKKLMMNNYSENEIQPIYSNFSNSQTNEYNHINIDWSNFKDILRIKAEIRASTLSGLRWIWCIRTSTYKTMSCINNSGNVRLDINSAGAFTIPIMLNSILEVIYNFNENKAYVYVDNNFIQSNNIPFNFVKEEVGSKLLVGCGASNTDTSSIDSAYKFSGYIKVDIYNQ